MVFSVEHVASIQQRGFFIEPVIFVVFNNTLFQFDDGGVGLDVGELQRFPVPYFLPVQRKGDSLAVQYIDREHLTHGKSYNTLAGYR